MKDKKHPNSPSNERKDQSSRPDLTKGDETSASPKPPTPPPLAASDRQGAETGAATDAPRAPAASSTPGGAAAPPAGRGGERPPLRSDGGGGGGSGLIVGVIALVLVVVVTLAAAGGGYWLRQQLAALETAQGESPQESPLGQQTQALQGDVERLSGRVSELREQLSERLTQLEERLSARLSDLGERVQGGGQGVAQLQQAIDSLRQQQQELSQRVDENQSLATASQQNWRLSEAAYLARMAEYRLRYSGDVDLALEALKAADELLQGTGGQAASARQGVTKAIDRLVEASPPNTAEIAQQLADLAGNVDSLPLAAGPEKLVASPDAGEAEASGDTWPAVLENAWQQFQGGLSELVVVSSDGKDVVPLRSAEERFFLAQNLKLQLEAARMAALDGEAALYESSLSRVQKWLEQYFDPSEKPVAQAIETVKTLAGKPVQADLPKIAPLLEPLHQFD